MLVYSDWNRWKAIIYKIIKLYGATYFSVYGVYITYNSLTANPDYFLLFIFSTVDFYVEMFCGINALDESDLGNPQYRLK